VLPRRRFLASCLALGAAPFVARAESLMRLPSRLIIPASAIVEDWGKTYLRLYAGELNHPAATLLCQMPVTSIDRALAGMAQLAPCSGVVIESGTVGHFQVEREGVWLVRGNVGTLYANDLVLDRNGIMVGDQIHVSPFRFLLTTP
jgi:hypothetical protein